MTRLPEYLTGPDVDEIIAEMKSKKILLTGREESRKCELCGKEAELRPYGPNREQVCFQCMKKDEPAAQRHFAARFLVDAVEPSDLFKKGKQ